MSLSSLKVALVHDWLNGMRGGEKVLEYFCRLFPEAPVYALHGELSHVSDLIRQRPVHFSFIQNLPFKKQIYRYYLPLFPKAIRAFDFRGYDLVISTSHCAAKNIVLPPGIPHLCYCFSPMRYVWLLREDYFGRNIIKRTLMHPVLEYLKNWDLQSTPSVSRFIAVSKTVQKRIQEFYGRDSVVLYPPVEIPFSPCVEKDDYYLVLSALVPYKRIDLAIEASRSLGFKLKIAGTGTEYEALKEGAPSSVEFLGWVSHEEKQKLLKKAKALLFPGLEDFGIVPLEAMAYGTPVIAFGQGGVTETVIPGKTGIFFQEQTLSALCEGISNSEKMSFKTEDFKEALLQFSEDKFIASLRQIVSEFIK